MQQIRRRIPIHLQKRVEKELNKLIDQKHIKKLDNYLEKNFISPIVVTEKGPNCNYQISNLELLLDKTAEFIKMKEKEPTLFSTRKNNATVA